MTTDFQNLSFRAQLAQRAWHVEVEKWHVETLKKLVEAAKEVGLVEATWGRQAHISEAADNDTSPGEIKRFIKFAQRHVNFHCSMTCDDLKGITNLDAKAAITSVSTGKKKDEVSMRQVLLQKFKLSNGTSLFAEVHQRGPLGAVDVIVPNTPEAESMVLMMNRHFPAFCYHYLKDVGLDETFVRALLKEACCPTLLSSIKACTWDAPSKSIVTAAQALEEASMKELENAAWYKDEFGKSLVENVKKLKTYADAEALYALDGELSVKTLHARNDERTSSAKKRKGTIKISSSDSDLSLSLMTSSKDDDLMDSASDLELSSPVASDDADMGGNSRVRFARGTPTPSAGVSASLPLAGGG